MPKVLLELYLPYAARSFDVAIPDDMTLGRAVPLAARALSEASGGLYVPDETAMLCRREDGVPLDIDMTAAALGLQNGTRLMLI